MAKVIFRDTAPDGAQAARRRRILIAIALIALLFALAWLIAATRLGKARGESLLTPASTPSTLAFPAGFRWGVAVAGQQIDSVPASDWSAFEDAAWAQGRFGTGAQPGVALPGHIHDFGASTPAMRREKTGFAQRYASDLDLARDMGLNAFRFSIEWARLFPRPDMQQPDAAAIRHYKTLIAMMRARGLEPYATLFHFASPAWFFAADAQGRRGWERADALVHWQRFVDAVADNFVADVSQWCTLNEPLVYVYNGYLQGVFPPLERRAGVADTADVLTALLQAHALAYHRLHAAARAQGHSVSVGLTKHLRSFAPLGAHSPLDRLSAQGVDQAWNWDIFDAIASGRLTIAHTGIDRPITGLKDTQDYLGINYYGRFYVRGNWSAPGRPTILLHDPQAHDEAVNDLGWASYPHGFYEVLSEAARRYGKPLQVLENGTADKARDDRARQRFIREHLRELWLAMHYGGADVRSYFHWTLFDNFEWAEGFTARFGLFETDYERNFARIPRPSAALYGQIVRANALTLSAP